MCRLEPNTTSQTGIPDGTPQTLPHPASLQRAGLGEVDDFVSDPRTAIEKHDRLVREALKMSPRQTFDLLLAPKQRNLPTHPERTGGVPRESPPHGPQTTRQGQAPSRKGRCDEPSGSSTTNLGNPPDWRLPGSAGGEQSGGPRTQPACGTPTPGPTPARDPPCSLSHGEGQLKVLLPLRRAQGAVVKGVREEGVHQGAEGHPVAPAGGEVLQVHVLPGAQGSTRGGEWAHGSPTGSPSQRPPSQQEVTATRPQPVRCTGPASGAPGFLSMCCGRPATPVEGQDSSPPLCPSPRGTLAPGEAGTPAHPHAPAPEGTPGWGRTQFTW